MPTTRSPTRAQRQVVLLFVCVAVAVGAALHLGAAVRDDDPTHVWAHDAARWQQPYVRWDADWYVQIAVDGYQFEEDLPSNAAFFPGFPVMARLAGSALGDTITGAILISLGAGLVTLLAMYAWTEALAPDLAWRATLLMALWPFALFLYGPAYGDGVLVAATLVAFWAVERDRSLWVAAASLVAAASRVIGVVVPVLLVLRLLERRRSGASGVVHPAIPLVGYATVVAHLVYLEDRFGDPLAFMTAARYEGWEEGISVRSVLKLDFLGIFTGSEPGDAVYHGAQVLSMLLTGVVLALLPRVWRTVSPAYAVAAGALIGIPLLSNNDFLGFGRYALASFPVALAGAGLLRERPERTRAVLLGSAAMLLAISALSGADYLIA